MAAAGSGAAAEVASSEERTRLFVDAGEDGPEPGGDTKLRVEVPAAGPVWDEANEEND